MLESELDPDPFLQFERWFAQARAEGVAQAEAMAVATAGRDGRPSVRMVLLKEHGPDGFVFYTGHGSRKGRDVAENPRAALLFFWQPLGRQVRVEGTVERAARELSERYFKSRPVGSQVAAAVSRQSEPVGSRDVLEERFAALSAEVGGAGPPLPEHWGGYVVRPEAFEFWEHRDDRLHDRVRYDRDAEDAWRLTRLQP
jgi:pyridoxamine 5'-phosphate oxidase